MKYFRTIFGVLFTLLLLAGLVGALFFQRPILDYIALRGYTPDQRIVALADNTGMNDYARKVFYVNHPEILGKPGFSKTCTQAEKTIVLGCYVSNDGIYLLDVEDLRLNGIIEVTAAHELLHAEYDRLSPKEKSKVDSMTAAFFATLQDQRIRENIENYRIRDPSVVPNELHSILASEVRDLSPELESYYGKYFKDRKNIVALSEKYEKTFTDIENQVAAYEVQLKSMRAQIEDIDSKLGPLEGEISAKKETLDSQLENNEVSEYNAGVAGFNSLVNRYNGFINQRQVLTGEYNTIVEEYNNLASTATQLQDALKTSPPAAVKEVAQ